MALLRTRGGMRRKVLSAFIVALFGTAVLWAVAIAISTTLLAKGAVSPVSSIAASGMVPSAPKAPPVSNMDLATILFSASSLALFIFSVLMGTAVPIAWGALKDWVRQELEKVQRTAEDLSRRTEADARKMSTDLESTIKERQATMDRDLRQRISETEREVHERVANSTQQMRDHLASTERETMGRSYTVLGNVLGALSTEVDRWEPTDQHQLRAAVIWCHMAFDLLQDRGEKLWCLAANNLVYYSSVLDDGVRADYLLELARKLRRAGEQHIAARHLLMTFCCAALHFSKEREELDSVRQIAAAMLRDQDASIEIKKEAAFYLKRVEEAIIRS